MANVKEYSVEEKLASLVNLQKVDSKLDEISILKGELPMEVSDLEDECLSDPAQRDFPESQSRRNGRQRRAAKRTA